MTSNKPESHDHEKYSWEKIEENKSYVWHTDEFKGNETKILIAITDTPEKAHFLATAANAFNKDQKAQECDATGSPSKEEPPANSPAPDKEEWKEESISQLARELQNVIYIRPYNLTNIESAAARLTWKIADYEETHGTIKEQAQTIEGGRDLIIKLVEEKAALQSELSKLREEKEELSQKLFGAQLEIGKRGTELALLQADSGRAVENDKNS